MTDDPRRSIPGVDRVLALDGVEALFADHGRGWVAECLRGLLGDLRNGNAAVPSSLEDYASILESRLLDLQTLSLGPVINATGVVLHTNLGRAPLAEEATAAMLRAAGYGNLEFDLDQGRRGSRYDHCVATIREIVGGEDALVVNNCAAATALALAAFARDTDVLVSHGELIEIGGGFRIPEVIEGAGARLRAVGTTNRTRLADFREALDAGGVGAILKVHRSNFRVEGFTEEVSLADLSSLAAERDVPLIHDLGSGLLIPAATLGLPDEPRPMDSVAVGCDVVAFSGDKLLGGPQAGILVGKKHRIAPLRKHPLCRAFRVDKATLAALEATLRLYRDGERAKARIPTLRMLAASAAEIGARAEGLANGISGQAPAGYGLEVRPGASVVGGGTYPGHEISTSLLAITPPDSADEFSRRLRQGVPPVVARTHSDQVLIDLRTVAPQQEIPLRDALVEAMKSVSSSKAEPIQESEA